jgi:hypothetical protein
MDYEHIEFDRSNITNLLHNVEEMLVIQTGNLECMMKRENDRRKDEEAAQSAYDTAFHSTFLKIIHGSIKTAEEKKIPASVAKDVAKAMCDNEWKTLAIAKGKLESASAVVRVESEKVNTLKKLIDDRNRLGG